MKKLYKSNIEIIEDNGAGNLISRLSNDTTLILQALESLLNRLLKDGLTALVLLITMIYLDWKLAIVICFLITVCSIPIYKIGKKVNNISKRVLKYKLDSLLIFKSKLSKYSDNKIISA